MGWGVNILYTGQYPPQDTSLEVSLPCSLLSSLNPSPTRFLPPAVNASSRPFLARSLHQPSLPQPSLPPLMLSACLASSLPLSHPPSIPPSLPPSLHPLVPSLPPLVPSLPPLVPFPHHPLAPSLPPTSLSPPLHPSYSSPTLPCSLSPILLHSPRLACPPPCLLPPAVQLNAHRVCVFDMLHCIV